MNEKNTQYRRRGEGNYANYNFTDDDDDDDEEEFTYARGGRGGRRRYARD